MTKKIKVVDVDMSVSAEPVTVTESNINEVVASVELPPEPEVKEDVAKPKRQRATKPKQEPIKEVVNDVVEVIEPPKVEVVEEPVKVEVVEEPKKNIKTVELVECPNCHKKLTERTLKYSHQAVCPATNPPQATPKPKPRPTTQMEQIQEPMRMQSIEEVREIVLPQITARMQRLNQRAERYKKLVVNAF